MTAVLDTIAMTNALLQFGVVGLTPTESADRTTWQIDFGPDVSTDQQAAARAALVAWAPPVTVPGDAIVSVLSNTQAALCAVRDLARIAYRDSVPVDNPKLVRIAAAVSMTPSALLQAAQGA